MVAIHGEIVGMFQEEFPSGFFYHVRVLAKCLGMAVLECFEPGKGVSPLGAGGSSQSSLWSGSSHRHVLHRIW